MKKIKKWLKHFFGKVITQPSESPNASVILVRTVWVLRIFIYFFGIYQIFRGDMLLGVMIVICVLFLVAPSFFTRNRITDIPLELEFFLFIIVFFQFIVGEAQGLYGSIIFYDDIVHFFFPFLISIMGFTIAYSLYFTGKLKVSVATMIIFVIIVTLGLGAFWEIVEFGSDTYLVPHFDSLHRAQGSGPDSAFLDTMTDLVHDLLGGIVGSLVASRYILEAKYNKRLKELFKEIIKHFFGGKIAQ
ncbi:MAG TPA: hypothetical protein VNA13_01935 [Xanthomonadales bacterium]|nr:hypothetical protein [Xanthomonadales bacterium]